MLYEVITGVIGRCYQVDERKEHGSEYQRIVDFISVITSYSIHYTKLYDLVAAAYDTHHLRRKSPAMVISDKDNQ